MTDYLKKLIGRLSGSEQAVLAQHIVDHHGIDLEDVGMLRDDIVSKTLELLEIEFSWTAGAKESSLFVDLDLDRQHIEDFSIKLIEEFELEEIMFAKIVEWTNIKDMVDYIEHNMGGA